ncbi:MAG: hypothetical protein CMK06_06795 [Ponticaulis sp.]|nr:hypothetical protein [Ponticaulis sp.]|tara:strand:- start:591 stop:1157 length:567 start_codon:yes stop_codon:yes gene_type:complete
MKTMLNRGGNSPFIRVITGVAFTSIALLIALDLISDGGEGASLVHLLLEGGILVIALLGAGLAFRSLRRTRAELSEARAEAVKWREEHSELLRGLSAAVGKQFSQWQLTAAEREIGYLLLKGLSLSEVAKVRGTSERTVRDQSQALYRKAGLSGRADLSGFFLEDLLLPMPAASEAPEAAATASDKSA